MGYETRVSQAVSLVESSRKGLIQTLKKKPIQCDIVSRHCQLSNRPFHDLLFAIQDAHDREMGIEVYVEGDNVAERSGMLQGEHLGDGGWIEKFSRFT